MAGHYISISNELSGAQAQVNGLGIEDVLLTFEADKTFFRELYPHYTNFARCETEQQFSSPYMAVQGGAQTRTKWDRVGDLMGQTWVRKVAPGTIWTNGQKVPPTPLGPSGLGYLPIGLYTAAYFDTVLGAAGQNQYQADPGLLSQNGNVRTNVPVYAATSTQLFASGQPSVNGVCYVDGFGFFSMLQAELVIGNTQVSLPYLAEHAYAMHNLNRQYNTYQEESLGLSLSGTAQELIVRSFVDQEMWCPLMFYNRFSCKSIPTIALSQHDIFFTITTQSAQALIGGIGAAAQAKTNGTNAVGAGFDVAVGAANLVAGQATIVTQVIVLDRAERQFVAKTSSDYLIEQAQVQKVDVTANLDTVSVDNLSFTHPVFAMAFLGRRQGRIPNGSEGQPLGAAIPGENSVVQLTGAYAVGGVGRWDLARFSDFSGGRRPGTNLPHDFIDSVTMTINSNVRFAVPGIYMREVLPSQFFTSKPYGFVYAYSLGERAFAVQPSGSLNFSQFDKVSIKIVRHPDEASFLLTSIGGGAQLPVAYPAASIFVLGWNHNKIYISGGMAGVAYA